MPMRGKPQPQPQFFTTINLNQRVPMDHPLRGIKARVDKIMAKLSPLFDQLYAKEGRPSIPPEQLLKSRLLIALYSVRISLDLSGSWHTNRADCDVMRENSDCVRMTQFEIPDDICK